jgi:hypothetical protein
LSLREGRQKPDFSFWIADWGMRIVKGTAEAPRTQRKTVFNPTAQKENAYSEKLQRKMNLKERLYHSKGIQQ